MCKGENGNAAAGADSRIESIRQKIATIFLDDSISDAILEWLVTDDEYGSADEKRQAVAEVVTEGLRGRDMSGNAGTGNLGNKY
jgi:hypothetical protein